MKYKNKIKSKLGNEKLKFGTKTLWFLVFCLVVLQIFSTIQNSAAGGRYIKIEGEISNILEVNRKIEDSLIKSASLSELGEKAIGLGFSKEHEVMNIKAGNTYASIFR